MPSILLTYLIMEGLIMSLRKETTMKHITTIARDYIENQIRFAVMNVLDKNCPDTVHSIVDHHRNNIAHFIENNHGDIFQEKD